MPVRNDVWYGVWSWSWCDYDVPEGPMDERIRMCITCVDVECSVLYTLHVYERFCSSERYEFASNEQNVGLNL